LIDDLARAEGHVTDFAIALGIPGEADRHTGSLEGGHGVVAIKFFEGGQGGFAERIALEIGGDTPTIKDNEDDGFVSGRWHRRRDKKQIFLSKRHEYKYITRSTLLFSSDKPASFPCQPSMSLAQENFRPHGWLSGKQGQLNERRESMLMWYKFFVRIAYFAFFDKRKAF
jgi:hypothetical protein